MKILFLLDVIWTNSKEGGVQSLSLLMNELHKKHQLTICTYDSFVEQTDFPNAELHIFQPSSCISSNKYLSFILNNIFILILNIKYIIRVLCSKQKPDLIYCSGGIPIIASILLRIWFRCKVIHRVYGTFLKPNSTLLELLKKYLEVFLFKGTADKYIITDDGTRGKQVAQSFGIVDDKIAFLKNGVNFLDISKRNEFRKSVLKELKIKSKTPIISISTCRLSRWKRVDRLVKAFNLIKDTNLYLLIVGDGTEKPNLENLATNPNILFLGPKSNEDVSKYLMASDLYLSAYDFSNLGNSLYESLTAGVPVITINTGATEEVINAQNENGILIDFINDDDCILKIKNSVLQISENTPLRKTLSKNAIKYAKKYFSSWHERIKKEIKIIEGL